MNLAEKRLCCGCGGCEAVCPFNAIKMQYDNDFFLYPVIDKKKCRDCGKCEYVCPIINKERIKIDSHNIRVVQGFIKDEKKHKKSASGGAATAFAEEIIKKGGCVFGSAYTEDYKKAIYIKVDKVEDLDRLKSSKYIETTKGEIYSEVERELNIGKIVLFTGLPCDIAGLKCYLKKEYSTLFTCELICHGPTAQKIQEDYLNILSKRKGSDVAEFTSRYKKTGREEPYIRVTFKNGKVFQRKLWDTEYGYAFAIYSRNSCYNCNFKGNDRIADISIGDSWSVKENFGDKKGVSIIYVHTVKGLELLHLIEKNGEFELQELDYEHVKDDNPAIRISIPISKERKKFSEILKKSDLYKAAFGSKSLKGKVKFIIKKLYVRE